LKVVFLKKDHFDEYGNKIDGSVLFVFHSLPCFLFFNGRRKRKKVLACASECTRMTAMRVFSEQILRFFIVTANRSALKIFLLFFF